MKTDKETESSKKNLRKKIISLRDSIPEKQRISKSNIIASKLFKNENYKAANNVLLFYPFGSEVDTRIIINDALLNKKKIILPRVTGKNIIEIYFVSDPRKELEPGFFGIMEPILQKCKPASLKDVDLAIIPGVCFDRDLNRLGYGGGFYDRLLSKLNKEVLKISLCFNIQIIENVPVSNYDMKVDMIITENDILKDLNN